MPTLKNFVAVDWRAGKDCIYFFFKDSNTYSRFDIGDNQVLPHHPTAITAQHWGNFHEHANNLRFGFTTTGFSPDDVTDSKFDLDILWLFYYDGNVPSVCIYNQNKDAPIKSLPIEFTFWHILLPYFDRIIAGSWWEGWNEVGRDLQLRFILNDGNSLHLKWKKRPVSGALTVELTGEVDIKQVPITASSWPGLEPYKHRIITAAQNDRTFADSYLYIFLTDNEYIAYNMEKNRVQHGPLKVDHDTWPGLLRS